MAQAHLALKVDVDTFRGTLEAVPNLITLLKQHGANATFLFSLGPDHSGRAVKRLFQHGYLSKVRRTEAIKHYGWKTLLYGTLLPGPDIGKECAAVMQQVRDAGFEVGIHSYDHVLWQDSVTQEDAAWTLRQMEQACQRFRDIFKTDPKIHGAAGWQMNRHAFRLTQRLGFDYCSDTRGTRPFVPVQNAEVIACPQLPTTLPTLVEILGMDGADDSALVNKVLDLTKAETSHGHVYTVQAEIEGRGLSGVLNSLLEGWRDQGYTLSCLGEYFQWLPEKNLPRHELAQGQVRGRPGNVMLQGREFLAPAPENELVQLKIS